MNQERDRAEDRFVECTTLRRSTWNENCMIKHV
jgi:hypothetical protein